MIFWLGIAGIGFSAFAAWRRHSAALALVVVMWAALWLPWARIDRAAFQYHVYASLPFLVLALAYFLAELWHGASMRVWFLARVAGALGILAIPLLWLFRTPLCILAGTAVAHPDGVACASEVTRTARLSESGVAALLLVAVGAGFAGFLGWRAARSGARSRQPDGDSQTLWLGALLVVALLTLGGVVAAFLFLDSSSSTPVTLTSDVLALMGLVVMAVPAWLVMRARDARRYVIAAATLSVLWLIVWYPNIAGLPLPSEFAHLYQGLLPTWNWDFQFAVNTDPAVDGSTIDATTAVVGIVTIVLIAGVGMAARRWRRPAPIAAQNDGDSSAEA